VLRIITRSASLFVPEQIVFSEPFILSHAMVIRKFPARPPTSCFLSLRIRRVSPIVHHLMSTVAKTPNLTEWVAVNCCLAITSRSLGFSRKRTPSEGGKNNLGSLNFVASHSIMA